MSEPEYSPEDVGDLLLKARNYLAFGHWCKHALKIGSNRCALGAMYFSAAGEMTARELYSAAQGALTDQLSERWKVAPNPDQMELVALFNDHSDTTLPDVLALFDKALAERGRLHEVQS